MFVSCDILFNPNEEIELELQIKTPGCNINLVLICSIMESGMLLF